MNKSKSKLIFIITVLLFAMVSCTSFRGPVSYRFVVNGIEYQSDNGNISMLGKFTETTHKDLKNRGIK